MGTVQSDFSPPAGLSGIKTTPQGLFMVAEFISHTLIFELSLAPYRALLMTNLPIFLDDIVDCRRHHKETIIRLLSVWLDSLFHLQKPHKTVCSTLHLITHLLVWSGEFPFYYRHIKSVSSNIGPHYLPCVLHFFYQGKQYFHSLCLMVSSPNLKQDLPVEEQPEMIKKW